MTSAIGDALRRERGCAWRVTGLLTLLIVCDLQRTALLHVVSLLHHQYLSCVELARVSTQSESTCCVDA